MPTENAPDDVRAPHGPRAHPHGRPDRCADHDHEPDVYELIVRTARRIRRRWMDALEPWGPSPHEFRALRAAIAADGGARLADIAERLRIAPRSATEVIDSLEEKGLVRRVPSPSDRRAVLVEPTAKGHDLAAQVLAERGTLGAELLAPLDDSEVAQLRDLLTRLDTCPVPGTRTETGSGAGTGADAGTAEEPGAHG